MIRSIIAASGGRPVSEVERLRTYLAGWDDGERCLLNTLLSIPVEHWEYVVRHRSERDEAGQ